MQTVSTRRDLATLALMLAGLAMGGAMYNLLPSTLAVSDRLMVSLWAGMAVFFLNLLVESWSERRKSFKAYSQIALSLTMASMAASNYLRVAGSEETKTWAWVLLVLQIPLLAFVYWCRRHDKKAIQVAKVRR
jgi:amino acid transporter